MKLSVRGTDLLMELEGCLLYPYDDRTGARVTKWNKYTTIGVGYLMPQKEFIKYKDGITYEQAIELLERTLPPFEECINTTVKATLKQSQYDALLCLVYNIGVSAFKTSSVLKMLNGGTGNYSTLEAAWKAFKMDNGKPSTGLLNRREHEWKLYSTGVY